MNRASGLNHQWLIKKSVDTKRGFFAHYLVLLLLLSQNVGDELYD